MAPQQCGSAAEQHGGGGGLVDPTAMNRRWKRMQCNQSQGALALLRMLGRPGHPIAKTRRWVSRVEGNQSQDTQAIPPVDHSQPPPYVTTSHQKYCHEISRKPLDFLLRFEGVFTIFHHNILTIFLSHSYQTPNSTGLWQQVIERGRVKIPSTKKDITHFGNSHDNFNRILQWV
mmetsp:Transcript_15324/g.26176  ORF Transcript_15324/g.26176 Transcript_15324/m.26176 type:complete len:174 (+) Transcript_15324:477-998(+)